MQEKDREVEQLKEQLTGIESHAVSIELRIVTNVVTLVFNSWKRTNEESERYRGREPSSRL